MKIILPAKVHYIGEPEKRLSGYFLERGLADLVIEALINRTPELCNDALKFIVAEVIDDGMCPECGDAGECPKC